MPNEGARLFTQVTKGTSDKSFQAGPREMPIKIGEATCVSYDQGRNRAIVTIQAGNGATVTSPPITVLGGFRPQPSQKVKTRLDHFVLYVEGPMDVLTPVVTPT